MGKSLENKNKLNDLNGGALGAILTKDSTTDGDFSWVPPTSPAPPFPLASIIVPNIGPAADYAFSQENSPNPGFVYPAVGVSKFITTTTSLASIPSALNLTEGLPPGSTGGPHVLGEWTFTPVQFANDMIFNYIALDHTSFSPSNPPITMRIIVYGPRSSTDSRPGNIIAITPVETIRVNAGGVFIYAHWFQLNFTVQRGVQYWIAYCCNKTTSASLISASTSAASWLSSNHVATYGIYPVSNPNTFINVNWIYGPLMRLVGTPLSFLNTSSPGNNPNVEYLRSSLLPIIAFAT